MFPASLRVRRGLSVAAQITPDRLAMTTKLKGKLLHSKYTKQSKKDGRAQVKRIQGVSWSVSDIYTQTLTEP